MVVGRPLHVSQAFRRAESIEAAIAAGADLVGVARPLIADPDFPSKILAGRAEEVRPCVSCNEDCRAFDPVLLCSVNPDLGPSTESARPATALLHRRGGRPAAPRIAVVGAGPAGLECATSITGRHEVVVFDHGERLGGALTIAAEAPNRSGWQLLLDYYQAAIARADNVEIRLGTLATRDLLEKFDQVVLAIGSEEVLPSVPGIERAVGSSGFIGQGPFTPAGVQLVIVDDSFGWWPCASALETGIAAGWENITVLTPAASFGARLPPEGRVQLLARLRGAPLEICPLTAVESIAAASVTTRNVISGRTAELPADVVVVVGERRPRSWDRLGPLGSGVRVVGDAVVPRRVQHAISEGRAAAHQVARE